MSETSRVLLPGIRTTLPGLRVAVHYTSALRCPENRGRSTKPHFARLLLLNGITRHGGTVDSPFLCSLHFWDFATCKLSAARWFLSPRFEKHVSFTILASFYGRNIQTHFYTDESKRGSHSTSLHTHVLPARLISPLKKPLCLWSEAVHPSRSCSTSWALSNY